MENVICAIRGAVLFVGNLPDLAFHSTVTSATVVGLDIDIKKRVKGNGEWMSARCFVFDGTLCHETILSGTVGILFADPGSEIGAILAKEAGPTGLSENPSWAPELISTCIEIFNANPDRYPEILAGSFPFNRLTPAKKIQDDARLVYVLRKLIENSEETINVDELAEASLAAGFFDQAHFTNVFREIFGISPSAVFGKGEPIRWYIQNEEIEKLLT